MQEALRTYAENAVRWAEGHLGSTAWPGRCLAFVEDAYEQSNQIEMFGGSSARESAIAYGVAPRPEVPPLGAFVFYDCSELAGERRNWGHVGLSLGDGRVIHSWGCVRIDSYRLEGLPEIAGWSAPAYIGWAPVERVLQGYRKR